MGVRWIATTLNSNDTKPKLYGKELRRTLLLAEGALKKIGRKGGALSDVQHKTSRAILNEAMMVLWGPQRG